MVLNKYFLGPTINHVGENLFDVLTQNHCKLRGWPTPWLSFRPYVYVGMDNYNLRTRRLPACCRRPVSVRRSFFLVLDVKYMHVGAASINGGQSIAAGTRGETSPRFESRQTTRSSRMPSRATPTPLSLTAPLPPAKAAGTISTAAAT